MRVRRKLHLAPILFVEATARTATEWLKGAVLQYATSSRPWRNLGFARKADSDMRNRGEELHCVAMSLVGWSDVGYGVQSTEVRSRLGSMIGLTPSPLTGPCHMLQRTSTFTRKLVKSCLGGEVYALSGTVYHMSPLRDFYVPFEGLAPAMAGLEDCESLLTSLETKKMVAEGYSARHFLRTD